MPSRRSSVGTIRLYASISNIIPVARSTPSPWFTVCLICRTEIGALAAIVAAVSSASLNSSSAVQMRLIMPHSYACAAENGTCSFTGTESVAYGADGIFTYHAMEAAEVLGA